MWKIKIAIDPRMDKRFNISYERKNNFIDLKIQFATHVMLKISHRHHRGGKLPHTIIDIDKIRKWK